MPLVIVDDLQRMRPPEADRRLNDHRQISLAGLGLRQLARDLSCPVLAIPRSTASPTTRPSRDAFKGSGDLEYDADACLLLCVAARSEEEAKSIATTQAVILVELHAVKNRYGALNAGAPGLLQFDRGHRAFRQQRSAPHTRGRRPLQRRRRQPAAVAAARPPSEPAQGIRPNCHWRDRPPTSSATWRSRSPPGSCSSSRHWPNGWSRWSTPALGRAPSPQLAPTVIVRLPRPLPQPPRAASSRHQAALRNPRPPVGPRLTSWSGARPAVNGYQGLARGTEARRGRSTSAGELDATTAVPGVHVECSPCSGLASALRT